MAYTRIDASVKTGTITDNGREIIYAVRKDGDVAGELCCLEPPRRDRAVAVQATEAIPVPFEEVMDTLARHPTLLQGLVEVLAHALAEAYDQVNRLADDNVMEGLIKVLKTLAAKLGRPSGKFTEINASRSIPCGARASLSSRRAAICSSTCLRSKAAESEWRAVGSWRSPTSHRVTWVTDIFGGLCFKSQRYRHAAHGYSCRGGRMKLSMPGWNTTFRVILVAMAGAATLGAAPPAIENSANPAVGDRQRIDRTSARLLHEGRKVFRYETFGDEAWWTDTIQLHKAIAGRKHGGVGKGVSPATALAVGLKVDFDAIPKKIQRAIARGAVDLNDPAVTLALLQLDAVVGVKATLSYDGNSIHRLGITCALCHSTVDNSFAPGIGRRLDGWANRDLNVGLIVSRQLPGGPLADARLSDRTAGRPVDAPEGRLLPRRSLQEAR